MSVGPHLDDTRLSALVDGEAAAGDIDHAAACADCAARVAAWQEARRLVAAAPDAADCRRSASRGGGRPGRGRPAGRPRGCLASRRPRQTRWARVLGAPPRWWSRRRGCRRHPGRGSRPTREGGRAAVGVTSARAAASTAGGPASRRAPRVDRRRPVRPVATPSQPAAPPPAGDGRTLGPRLGTGRPGGRAARPPARRAGRGVSPVRCRRRLPPPRAGVPGPGGRGRLPGGSPPVLEASLTYRGAPAAPSSSRSASTMWPRSWPTGCRLLADVTF